MNERSMQFRVGILVFATLLATGILALLFGEVRPFWEGSYTIYVRFTSAPGVTRDTPVRKNGLTIGRVSNVQFAENDTAVLVTAEIRDHRQLYKNEDICYANTPPLLGDTTLDFVRDPHAHGPPTLIVPGETISGTTRGSAAEAIADLKTGLTETMESVNRATGEMSTAMVRVTKLLDKNEERLTDAIARADDALKSMQTALTNVNKVVGDPQAQREMREAIRQLPIVLGQTRDTLDVVGQSVTSLQKDLRGVTKPLGEHGAELVERINYAAGNIDHVSDELLKFSVALNRPDSSLGQLVNSPDLYQHLNRAARNVDELTRELRPILDDARVFSDKIARHPEMLGVRGALQRSQGIK